MRPTAPLKPYHTPRRRKVHLDSAALISGNVDTKIPFLGDYTLSWSLDGDTARHAFPMPRATYDSIRAMQGDTGRERGQIVAVHARAKYSSVEEMAAATCLTGWTAITPSASLEKSFRWFRTKYTFRETYPQQKIIRNISQQIPLTRRARLLDKGHSKPVRRAER